MTGKVLLVEDEPNIIEAIRFILSRDGWSVHVHSDGATAVEAVASQSPGLVILDVMLPNRSGYDILAELRQDAGTERLPVLMLTVALEALCSLWCLLSWNRSAPLAFGGDEGEGLCTAATRDQTEQAQKHP